MTKKYYFAFCKEDLLLEKLPDGRYTIPFGVEPPTEVKAWTHQMNVTPMDDGTPVITYRIDAPVTDSDRYEMCGLRQSYYKLVRPLYKKAGKCQELLYWDQNTKYCGVCGAPMRMDTDISKKCTECGKEIWPQLATAVIVLIHKDDEVLLVRAKNFKRDFFGLVAGFVETGETLEEAVAREALEETGVTITNIRYFGSQPWGITAGGLLLGYWCEVDGDDIVKADGTVDYFVLDMDEIARLKVYSGKANQYWDNEKRMMVQRPNALYGKAADCSDIDTGFLKSKTVKHAFKGYPKLSIGAGGALEADKDTDPQPQAEPQPVEAQTNGVTVETSDDDPFNN